MFELFLFLWIIYFWAFIYAIKYENNSVVDLLWWIVPMTIALWTYNQESIFSLSQTLITLLVVVWGIRLTLNILSKKWEKFHSEDIRYTHMKKNWKYPKLRTFFQVFVLQFLLVLIVSLPIFIGNTAENLSASILFPFCAALCALLWLLYESRADAELAGFIINKKSWNILTWGLRKFHRYPQYFWELVFWLWISLLAVQFSLWSMLSVGVVFFLLRYVSGVPLLEARYESNSAYKKYSEDTPIFFPNYKKIFQK